MALMTQAEYTKHCEGKGYPISRQGISKAVAAGKIPLVSGVDAKGNAVKLIDSDVADAVWLANRDHVGTPVVPAGAAASAPTATFTGQQPGFEFVPPEPGSRAEAEARVWQVKAREAERVEKLKAGELAPLAELEEMYTRLVMATQNVLLLLPDKYCDQLAASKDPAECRSILERGMRDALKTLSQTQLITEMAA